jgi:hypothetical protein
MMFWSKSSAQQPDPTAERTLGSPKLFHWAVISLAIASCLTACGGDALEDADDATVAACKAIQEDAEGRTSPYDLGVILGHAAMNGCFNEAVDLLEAGADPNAHYVWSEEQQVSFFPLGWAIYREDNALQNLLQQYGAKAPRHEEYLVNVERERQAEIDRQNRERERQQREEERRLAREAYEQRQKEQDERRQAAERKRAEERETAAAARAEQKRRQSLTPCERLDEDLLTASESTASTVKKELRTAIDYRCTSVAADIYARRNEYAEFPTSLVTGDGESDIFAYAFEKKTDDIAGLLLSSGYSLDWKAKQQIRQLIFGRQRDDEENIARAIQLGIFQGDKGFAQSIANDGIVSGRTIVTDKLVSNGLATRPARSELGFKDISIDAPLTQFSNASLFKCSSSQNGVVRCEPRYKAVPSLESIARLKIDRSVLTFYDGKLASLGLVVDDNRGFREDQWERNSQADRLVDVISKKFGNPISVSSKGELLTWSSGPVSVEMKKNVLVAQTRVENWAGFGNDTVLPVVSIMHTDRWNAVSNVYAEAERREEAAEEKARLEALAAEQKQDAEDIKDL